MSRWSAIRFALHLWLHDVLDRLSWWLAYRIPRDVALLVFVRVYTAGNREAPGPEYERAYKAFAQGDGR